MKLISILVVALLSGCVYRSNPGPNYPHGGYYRGNRPVYVYPQQQGQGHGNGNGGGHGNGGEHGNGGGHGHGNGR